MGGIWELGCRRSHAGVGWGELGHNVGSWRDVEGHRGGQVTAGCRIWVLGRALGWVLLRSPQCPLLPPAKGHGHPRALPGCVPIPRCCSPLPISPTGPEIPLSSYPPAAPPAPFPMDPKAGPVPPQPGFTPMAMYPPAAPTAQYPLYPSGPPVYNPTGEHWAGTHTPLFPRWGTVASLGADTPSRPPHSAFTLRPGTAQLPRSLSPCRDPGTPLLPPASTAGLGISGTLGTPVPPPWDQEGAPVVAGSGPSRPPRVTPRRQHRAALVPHTGPFVAPLPRAPMGGTPGGPPRAVHGCTPAHPPLDSAPPGSALNHVLCPTLGVVSVAPRRGAEPRAPPWGAVRGRYVTFLHSRSAPGASPSKNRVGVDNSHQ